MLVETRALPRNDPFYNYLFYPRRKSSLQMYVSVRTYVGKLVDKIYLCHPIISQRDPEKGTFKFVGLLFPF